MKGTRRSQPKSITAGAFEQLREDILSGTLRPGLKLKIKDLCDRLNVSLGAVREALSRLTAEGLVISIAQKGFQVAPVSREELVDLTSVRVEIVSLCLERSIRSGDLNWETAVVSAYHRMSRTPMQIPNAGISTGWLDAHADFHASLVAACESPWLIRLRKMLYEQSERYRRLSAPYGEGNRNIEAEHQALFEAVLARDTKAATELVAKHIRSTSDILIERLDQLNEAAAG